MIAASRRRLIATAGASLAALGAPAIGRAQTRSLQAFGHRVHQAVTNGPGGDVLAGWRAAEKAEVNWTTLGDVAAINERLLREVTLSETSIDLAHLLNGRALPRTLALFEPLDAHMQRAPIEDFADVSPGLVAPMRLDGSLRAVPMRHATNTLIWNEAIFAERGIAGPPRTFEELLETARKLTFARPDGTQVFGLVFTTVFASNFLSFARSLDGDYMTLDGRVVCAEPPMVKALAALADLHKAGAMPRNMNAMNNEEITTWIQQGRVAMTINPFARVVSYNDPATSKAPGRIKAAAMPMAADLAGKVPYAATTEYWSYAIPRNSRNKELAWSLIRALSAKAGTLGMALNGNGPVRVSTYADPAFANGLAHAALEAQALKDARIHLPAFDNQARAHDVFVEESQAAMLGMKPADKAMADAERRVKAML